MNIGKRVWLAPDCFWPEITTPGHYVSHEAICVLNTGDSDAEISITLYFEDREPMSGFKAVVGARRTNHIRMDKLTNADGEGVPMGVPYSALVESNVDVICQYTRVDTTQVNESVATTMMY